MGVVNATPDSFSDGQIFFSPQLLKERLEYFLKTCHIIDIGAQSTAPQAASLTQAQEWQRWEDLVLPVLDSINWNPQVALSCDTYRVKTMEQIIKWALNKKNLTSLWFNDVSGIVDSEVLSFLKDYPQVNYILCHNQVPQREATSKHMNFQNPNLTIFDMENFFREKAQIFSDEKLSSRWWADPALGFAKSREQNLAIFSQLPSLFASDFHHQWVLAISRKSFLRSLDESARDPQVQARMEAAEHQYVSKLMETLPSKNTFAVRTHRPDLYQLG